MKEIMTVREFRERNGFLSKKEREELNRPIADMLVEFEMKIFLLKRKYLLENMRFNAKWGIPTKH